MALRGALGSGLGARDAAAFCVAGVAQPYIHLRFTWQAWHNLTSTFVSRGRRGKNSHLPSFHVAGVALMALLPSFHVAGVASMALRGALGSGLGARDAAAFCVAGVAQPYIHLRLRGRRGTTLHPPSFHVASMAQSDIYHRFAWQTWHSWHSVAHLRFGRAWRRGTLRGRRGTIWHLPSFRVAGVALMALCGALGSGLAACDAAAFCVAGVAQPYIHLRFTWQAWHKLTSTFGRRGTTLHPPSFHVAGVAQSYIHLRFAWQAWHLWHWVARLVRICELTMPRLFACFGIKFMFCGTSKISLVAAVM